MMENNPDEGRPHSEGLTVKEKCLNHKNLGIKIGIN